MRLRILSILLIIFGLTTVVFGQASPVATDDPFELTSTAMVAAATQAALTGPTAIPVSVQAQIAESDLSATVGAARATQLASTTVDSEPDEPDSASVLPQTLMVFGVFLTALLILGAIVVRIRSNDEEQAK